MIFGDGNKSKKILKSKKITAETENENTVKRICDFYDLLEVRDWRKGGAKRKSFYLRMLKIFIDAINTVTFGRRAFFSFISFLPFLLKDKTDL